jgi:hypothetical protein
VPDRDHLTHELGALLAETYADGQAGRTVPATERAEQWIADHLPGDVDEVEL